MKTLRSLAVGFLVLLAVGVAVDAAHAQTSRTITRQFELEPDGHVELDTFTGEIDVTGWDQETVDVEARIEGDDEELVEKTAVNFDRGTGHLIIEVDYDEVKDTQQFLGLFSIGDVDRPDVHVTIKMPRAAKLTIDDFSSDIKIADLDADVTLDTFSSSVRLSGIRGTLNLETFSGSIEGDGLRGRVRLETFSGDVELGFLELGGATRIETFSGDVELMLPADAQFELTGDDDTFGELSSEFALKIQDGRRIAGAGGPEIDVESFSGSIRLRKQ